MKITTKLWIGLVILIVLSPIGLFLPEHFKAGAAWGEWGVDEIRALVGYIPKGLEKLSSIWNAPIPDYAFKGWQEKGLGSMSIAYIFSAIVGIAITALVVILIGKALALRRWPKKNGFMRAKRNLFIEKSLVGAVSFLKDSVFTEEYAVKSGFLQSIDPRIKTISFAVFILAVLFLETIAPILLLYCFVLILSVLSKIDPAYFLKRTWIFIPLFSLFIAIPALFSFFSPGEVIISFKLLSVTLSVTRQGLVSAALFVSRVITSVSIVVLLSLTTRHTHILYTLRIFKIPSVFIMTIGMCYRYIYLFAKTIEDTYIALKSRTAATIPSGRGQRIASWNMANLWHRSFILHKEVYAAMVSRGYSGEGRIAASFKLGVRDWIWLAASITIGLVLWMK